MAFILQNTHKGRRIRPVNRKPMVVQRTLLPKAAPRQMFTFVPMVTATATTTRTTTVPSPTTIIGQPMGIPVNIQPSVIPSINVPNNRINNRILPSHSGTCVYYTRAIIVWSAMLLSVCLSMHTRPRLFTCFQN